MTTEIDSATPIYHPIMESIAMTLMITIDTQPIEIMLWIMFWVDIRRIMNANTIAMKIPPKADVTNDFSVGIHAQAIPAVWNKLFSPSGAFCCYFMVHY